jgi:hypothetical protein
MVTIRLESAFRPPGILTHEQLSSGLAVGHAITSLPHDAMAPCRRGRAACGFSRDRCGIAPRRALPRCYVWSVAPFKTVQETLDEDGEPGAASLIGRGSLPRVSHWAPYFNCDETDENVELSFGPML